MAWRYCGNQVKLWRMRAGVSREVLGDKAGYEYETVKSMEQGRRRPSLRLLEVADELCGARGLLLAAQEYLKPEKYPWFSMDFMRYESEAIAHSSYEPLLIPGLLQNEETARALLESHWPPLDDETVEERVAARLERQSLLEKQTKAFTFVIGEAAVRYPVDSGEAHKRQLLHLLAAAKRRNVTIQVMPFDRGAHPGLNGPYVLLETPEHEQLAYEEGQTRGVLYATPEQVSLVSQRHAMILQKALSPEESVRYIGKLAEEL
ncbi:helix-turn-helix domain-containing protein [Streptantibioticus rubrisoli]|uniref:Helix-turn-helix domain-containing protein n=1 Tax=Streptantibioticus rubrisoli TaxID=1387313 RepID=A0ABT1PJJ2_9ACTN|nr:helix-turn-helix transcriptional regulator [Streptantibioticus rubrisoli]MCQ4045533.1 helix-turn-helix domain-containing protein [Streptantibioticus rubrisoli]